MILLKDFNILFIKGIKVAGSSFELALSKFANMNDIVTPMGSDDELKRSNLNLQGPVNFKYTKFELFKKSRSKFVLSFKNRNENLKFHEHISAKNLRDILGKDYFNKLIKVAIVRNPYNYLVSRYYWSIAAAEFYKKEEILKLSFEDWVRKYPETINENTNLIKIKDKFIIDEVIKFENFDTDIPKFEKKYAMSGFEELFKITNSKSGFNKSKKNIKELYSNKSLIETVYYMNQDFMSYFDYKKLND